jgi:carbon-monoxide dehydrogenase medium subunit
VKAAAFDYAAPTIVATASALLAAAQGGAKPIAGGQSLGPMLNLRLTQPECLIDIASIAALCEVAESADAVTLGAGITHAMIEDGRVPDPSNGLMPEVASNIAYRAVRNRGTLGGSLAHADPAADWVSTMRLLDATYLVSGAGGLREVASSDFMHGAFTTALADDEILVGLCVPRCSARTQFGYYKYCRKVGEFAEAIGAVLVDPARGIKRAVIGATAGAPRLVEEIDAVLALDLAAIEREVRAAGCEDAYELRMHTVALKRAVQRATT